MSLAVQEVHETSLPPSLVKYTLKFYDMSHFMLSE